MPTDPLLDDLTAAQRRAVTAQSQPLCIVAGAGAGKTRVLTRRIAYRVRAGSASPDHVLVVTFTRKAAVELLQRLGQLGLRDRVTAGTFHSLASAQLRSWWADRGQRPPTLLERKGRLIAPLLADRPALTGLSPRDAASHIEWAKARLIDPAHFADAVGRTKRALPVPAAEVARLFARYEDEKRRRGLMDFDDLLTLCGRAFDTDPTFAAAQRWRWRHFFVDEFQDLNPLQDRLLSAWLGPRADLCAVGDPNQAIYGWNGADPRLFEGLPARWPSTEVIHLDQNHRCTPQVVNAAAAVLGDAGRALRSSRPDGPAVEVCSYPTDAAESAGVAQELRRSHAVGLSWSHLAILVRTNAQIPAFAEALDARQIPYRAPGATGLLAQPAVLAALDELRQHPRPLFRMAVKDLHQLASEAARPPRSATVLESTATPAQPATTPTPLRPAAELLAERDDEQVAALTTLAHLADDYLRLDSSASLAGFETWLAATLRHESAPDDRGQEAVTICTFHRAKGLEWPAVWVCGLELGLVPHNAAKGPARDEERRLLYVALTRAERELHCSYAQQRRFGPALVPREASPWLDLIDRRRANPRPEPQPEQARATWFAHLRASRERLAAATSMPDHTPSTSGSPQTSARSPQRDARPSQAGPSPLRRAEAKRQAGRSRSYSGCRTPLLPAEWPTPDPQVLEALRAWRSDLALRSGIPAGVLLHDVTLQAVASLRPSTEQELAGMPGLGPVQARRYAATLLPLVGERRASA